MKKAYGKPIFLVENFRLTQQIASCSTVQINYQDTDCLAHDDDVPESMRDFILGGIFWAGICNDAPLGMDDVEGLCYHTMTDIALGSFSS